MPWTTYRDNWMFRICWDDDDGRGMTLGEGHSPREPDLKAIQMALKAVDTPRDSRGFFWETGKEALAALRVVKAADKAFKAKQPACCPTCKRPLEKS